VCFPQPDLAQLGSPHLLTPSYGDHNKERRQTRIQGHKKKGKLVDLK